VRKCHISPDAARETPHDGRLSARSPALVATETDAEKWQGYISAALVVGGMDCTGPSLFTIHPHGSVDQLPYVTMGSGSLAAMAIYEAGFQDNMNQEDAVNLVRASIQAGVDNDLGSGSNVDITVIKLGSVERFRSHRIP
jgi:20S proteasome subunit beta 2